MRRNTIQRELVLDAVRTLKNHATAQEVYHFIKENHPNISKGTVYRNLSILEEENLIHRIEVPGGCDRFDHITTKHYHAKCIKCGRYFDLQVDDLPNLKSHIKDDLGIKLLDFEILFNGICPECK